MAQNCPGRTIRHRNFTGYCGENCHFSLHYMGICWIVWKSCVWDSNKGFHYRKASELEAFWYNSTVGISDTTLMQVFHGRSLTLLGFRVAPSTWVWIKISWHPHATICLLRWWVSEWESTSIMREMRQVSWGGVREWRKLREAIVKLCNRGRDEQTNQPRVGANAKN